MPEEDLERKYFAFNFYADYTEETSALAVFQVRNRRLEEVWNPCEHFPAYDLDQLGSQVVSRAALAFLRARKVKEVLTFGRDSDNEPTIDTFLGYTLHWGNLNGWGHYDGLYSDYNSYWSGLFGESGIELKLFNPENKKLKKV